MWKDPRVAVSLQVIFHLCETCQLLLCSCSSYVLTCSYYVLHIWTSLVALWMRIWLPVQETRAQSLIWEDPTCQRATELVHNYYWDCALEPESHKYWSHKLEAQAPYSLCSATTEAITVRSPHTTTREKPAEQWRLSTAKNNKKKMFKIPSCSKFLCLW